MGATCSPPKSSQNDEKTPKKFRRDEKISARRKNFVATKKRRFLGTSVGAFYVNYIYEAYIIFSLLKQIKLRRYFIQFTLNAPTLVPRNRRTPKKFRRDEKHRQTPKKFRRDEIFSAFFRRRGIFGERPTALIYPPILASSWQVSLLRNLILIKGYKNLTLPNHRQRYLILIIKIQNCKGFNHRLLESKQIYAIMYIGK